MLSDPQTVINHLLQTAKPQPLLQVKEMLREAYDVDFGIFNHLKQAQLESAGMKPELKRPLASVALHPAEDWAGKDTQLELVMRGFADNDVGQNFHMSFVEFLALPVEYAERLMRISKTILQRKNNQTDAQRAALTASMAGR